MSKLIFRKLISQISRFRRDEDGVVLVLVAAALVAILGFTALVTDVGALALEKRRLQNACDAAALAAAQELPSRDDAKTIGEEYLQLYQVHEVPEIDFDEENKQVTVKVEGREVNFIFAKVLGMLKGYVKAEATATMVPIKSIKGKTGVIGGVDPIGISEEVFESGAAFGTTYELVSAKNNDIIGPGNFGFLALGGAGESNLEQNFSEGYKGTVENEVVTEPGNIGGPSERALLSRKCQHDPRCTPDEYHADCPALLTVVILKEGNVCGREKAEIVGFATFLLVDVCRNEDNDKVVKGTFLEYTLPKNSEFIIDPDGEDYGLVAPRLIK